MLDNLYRAYGVLDKVVSDGAYSSIELSKKSYDNHGLITKIVYGVLDNYIRYDYYIGQLVKVKPQRKVRIILMIGMYCIENMDSMPNYAIVDNIVELTKKIGKKQLSGFVNAVIKKSIDYQYNEPNNLIERLSIRYSKPIFLVKNYIDNYGNKEAENILATQPYELEHVRHNSIKINKNELTDLFRENDIQYIDSRVGGYYLRLNSYIYELFNQGLITFQSMTSMLSIQAMELSGNPKILDLCSAPGGKSVYMAELMPSSTVLSCDIHDNRLRLVQSYIDRMGVKNIQLLINDATIHNANFLDRFDYVLCDVPCSGMGLIHKKPDIAINKSIKDIEKLNRIQYNIINNTGDYVKKGGILLYATCSTMKSENQDIINRFLRERKDYRLEPNKILGSQGYQTFLPDNNGQDGFFIARLRRV